jgi:diacylglycerol kinase (ATP)
MIAPPPIKPRRSGSTPRAARMRATTLRSSFRYAFAGLRYLLWSQRNAKIQSTIAAAAIGLGVVSGLDRYEWLALLVMITLVIAAEGVNTALEAVVDLTSPEYHPLAKVAKDVGAGTVLITAIASVIVGAVLFAPHFLPIVRRWLGT